MSDLVTISLITSLFSFLSAIIAAWGARKANQVKAEVRDVKSLVGTQSETLLKATRDAAHAEGRLEEGERGRATQRGGTVRLPTARTRKDDLISGSE